MPVYANPYSGQVIGVRGMAPCRHNGDRHLRYTAMNRAPPYPLLLIDDAMVVASQALAAIRNHGLHFFTAVLK